MAAYIFNEVGIAFLQCLQEMTIFVSTAAQNFCDAKNETWNLGSAFAAYETTKEFRKEDRRKRKQLEYDQMSYLLSLERSVYPRNSRLRLGKYKTLFNTAKVATNTSILASFS